MKIWQAKKQVCRHGWLVAFHYRAMKIYNRKENEHVIHVLGYCRFFVRLNIAYSTTMLIYILTIINMLTDHTQYEVRNVQTYKKSTVL